MAPLPGRPRHRRARARWRALATITRALCAARYLWQRVQRRALDEEEERAAKGVFVMGFAAAVTRGSIGEYVARLDVAFDADPVQCVPTRCGEGALCWRDVKLVLERMKHLQASAPGPTEEADLQTAYAGLCTHAATADTSLLKTRLQRVMHDFSLRLSGDDTWDSLPSSIPTHDFVKFFAAREEPGGAAAIAASARRMMTQRRSSLSINPAAFETSFRDERDIDALTWADPQTRKQMRGDEVRDAVELYSRHYKVAALQCAMSRRVMRTPAQLRWQALACCTHSKHFLASLRHAFCRDAVAKLKRGDRTEDLIQTFRDHTRHFEQTQRAREHRAGDDAPLASSRSLSRRSLASSSALGTSSVLAVPLCPQAGAHLAPLSPTQQGLNASVSLGIATPLSTSPLLLSPCAVGGEEAAAGAAAATAPAVFPAVSSAPSTARGSRGQRHRPPSAADDAARAAARQAQRGSPAHGSNGDTVSSSGDGGGGGGRSASPHDKTTTHRYPNYVAVKYTDVARRQQQQQRRSLGGVRRHGASTVGEPTASARRRTVGEAAAVTAAATATTPAPRPGRKLPPLQLKRTVRDPAPAAVVSG